MLISSSVFGFAFLTRGSSAGAESFIAGEAYDAGPPL